VKINLNIGRHDLLGGILTYGEKVGKELCFWLRCLKRDKVAL